MVLRRYLLRGKMDIVAEVDGMPRRTGQRLKTAEVQDDVTCFFWPCFI